ncbi:hypothetical protein M422DRAFT_245303 [Sphaerobolus stellatus SS14]|nr:hypothetical protein M422DRAFT_245303 [Sphaerobolus stellatus SS14]
MTITTSSTLNTFEAGTNGPMEAVPIGPRPTILTNNVEDQWQNVPPNLHPLYTSPSTGTYLPPTLSNAEYEEQTDSSVIITQPWQAATGGYISINGHPLPPYPTSYANISTVNTIVPSSTEGFFETHPGPSYVGIADDIPSWQAPILERATEFQPGNFVFTAEAFNTGGMSMNGDGNHPSFSDMNMGPPLRTRSEDVQHQYHTSLLSCTRYRPNSEFDTEVDQTTSTDGSRKRSHDLDEPRQATTCLSITVTALKTWKSPKNAVDEKEVTGKAIEEFQVRVCTEYAFPEGNPSELKLMALKCWENACAHYEMDIPMMKVTHRLITSRVSTIRGRIKDKVVAKLAGKYGFLESPDEEDINANKALVEKLLKDFSYIYKDPDNLRGMYEHPIVADVIAHQFFHKRARSEGIEYSASFNPIPEPLIALVFTAVHFVIDQWKDGTYTAGASFKETEYHAIYKRHLGGLKKWREFNLNTAKALAQYQQRLYDYGSQRAGFKPRAKTPPNDPFAQDRLAQAAAALEDI